MIYLSKKIKFEKESESLKTNLHDKEIKQNKKILNQLIKVHDQVSGKLIVMEKLYDSQKEKVIREHEKLISQREKVYARLFKLEIYKDQLEANVNPEIRLKKSSILRKYLLGFYEQKNMQIIKQVGGLKNFCFIKRMIRMTEINYLVKPVLKSTIFRKFLPLWDIDDQNQKVMILVKKLQEQKYLLEVYNVKSPYFYMKRHCSKAQIQLIEEENPLKNLVILKKKQELYFLPEYTKKNQKKLVEVLKKYQLKIHLQKERRKMVFFKRVTITNIFQTNYKYPGYEDLQLDCLMILKSVSKSDFNIGLLPHEDKKHVLTLENIKSYPPEHTFLIQDAQILQKDEYLFKELKKGNFLKAFLDRYLVFLGTTERKPENLIKSDKIQLKQDGPKFLKIINFNQVLLRIVYLQNLWRMIVQNRKYNQQKRLKDFISCIYNRQAGMLLSCFAKKKKIVIIIEYIGKQELLEKKRKFEYEIKYEKIIKNLITNYRETFIGFSLISQISSTLETLLNQAIEVYEQQQEIIRKSKPEKALNRLKRFFINLSLRMRARRNIYCIKKIYKNFGIFVLIIRKSPILKDAADIHLFALNQKQKYKKISFLKEHIEFILSMEKSSKFRNLEDEFFISQSHFFIKPYSGDPFTFIERLAPVKLNNEEIQKELTNKEEENLSASVIQRRIMKQKTNKNSLFSSNLLGVAKQTNEASFQVIEPQAFYTVYKNENGLFFLTIFMTQCNGVSEYLKKVHKQQVSKKDIMESGLTQWIKNSEEFSGYRKFRLNRTMSNKSLLSQSSYK